MSSSLDSRPTGATDVVIVGAGPTGLMLACELARRGIGFRLLEAAPGPQQGSRGKGLQPRTLEIFDDLGIVDRVLANGRLAMPMWAIDADGSERHGGAVPERLRDRPDIPYPASVITPQWRTEEALRDGLSALGGTVEFATSVARVEQSDTQVSAAVLHGDKPETITASWLVGCDGGHSVVRQQAGIAFDGETLEDVRMIVADVEIDGLDREAWRIWPHAEGFMALCPLPSTDVFQYQAGIAEGQDPSLTLDNLQAVLDRRTNRSDIVLRDPAWTSLWRANVRLVERYRTGRVLLAGDAAHIHSPAGGQGMNTGIQDAHNLGWKLAAVLRGADPALLDTYEAERRPVAAGVLAMSNERLRDTLEHNSVPIDRSAGSDTTQLSVNYRGSTLARDDRADDAVLRAGDRVPDATGLGTVDGEHRLFDLLRGGQWTLLAFGEHEVPDLPGDVRVLRVRAEPTIVGEFADPTGQVARLMGAAERTLVLIRPDGYVGLISDAGEVGVVSDYLTALR